MTSSPTSGNARRESPSSRCSAVIRKVDSPPELVEYVAIGVDAKALEKDPCRLTGCGDVDDRIEVPALDNRPAEQPAGIGRGNQGRHRHRSGRVAADRDAVWVAAERGDVVLYPAQREHLILQPEIAAPGIVVAEEQAAQIAQAIVESHDDDAVLARVPRSVQPQRIAGSAQEGAAVHQTSTGARPARSGLQMLRLRQSSETTASGP